MSSIYYLFSNIIIDDKKETVPYVYETNLK